MSIAGDHPDTQMFIDGARRERQHDGVVSLLAATV
jgi:hypothetical protein